MAFPILGTPRPQFSDSTGVLAAGTVQVLNPADDTNATYYPTANDADAGTNGQSGNITLNANGMTPDGFFGVDGFTYKIIVQDSSGNTIWSETDIHAPGDPSRTVYTPDLDDASATTVQAFLDGLPEVSIANWASKDTGTAADRRQDMQNAIDACAGKFRLFIPSGTWLVDDALQWKTGSHLRGAGIDVTILKLDDTAHEDSNILEPESKDSSITNWHIEGMTLDGNYSRGTVSGVGSQRPGSSCLATMGARHGRIVDVKVKDAVLHGLDVCNGGELDGSGDRDYVLDANEAVDYYPSNESQYIWIDRVFAEDCGDDGITGHYSKDVFVGAVYASSTGGRHPTTTASNSFEIDDGCRRWAIEKVVAEGGNRGFAAKTHTPQPSPQDIQVGQISVSGCRTGVFIDGAGTSNPATGVQIGSVVVRNPADVNGDSTPASDVPFMAVELQDCRYCTVGQIVAVAEGDESFDLDEALLISTNSEHISVGRIVAVNWPYNNTDDAALAGVRITASCSDIQIGQISLKDCGFRGVLDSGADRTILGMVNARLTSSIASSVGIRFAVALATANSTVTADAIDGYATETSYG